MKKTFKITWFILLTFTLYQTSYSQSFYAGVSGGIGRTVIKYSDVVGKINKRFGSYGIDLGAEGRWFGLNFKMGRRIDAPEFEYSIYPVEIIVLKDINGNSIVIERLDLNIDYFMISPVFIGYWWKLRPYIQTSIMVNTVEQGRIGRRYYDGTHEVSIDLQTKSYEGGLELGIGIKPFLNKNKSLGVHAGVYYGFFSMYQGSNMGYYRHDPQYFGFNVGLKYYINRWPIEKK